MKEMKQKKDNEDGTPSRKDRPAQGKEDKEMAANRTQEERHRKDKVISISYPAGLDL